MDLIVYSVIVTYDDYSQDIDNIFSTKDGAVKSAKKTINDSSVIEVRVNQERVDETGRHWLNTAFVETKKSLG